MQAFQLKPLPAARGFSGKPAPIEPPVYSISQAQLKFVHSESGAGGGGQLQFPFSGPQPQFQSHHASNSSRCSSSVIENSSSSPNWLRSFSVITTSKRGWLRHSRNSSVRVEDAARCGRPKQSGSGDAELTFFSLRDCEVQCAAIKSDCCK